MFEYKVVTKTDGKELKEEELNNYGKNRWILCVINKYKKNFVDFFPMAINTIDYHFYRQRIEIPEELKKKDTNNVK